MLTSLSDQIKKLDNLTVPHRGRVVDNNDSDMLGRIKCQIKGIFETSDTNKLPWIFPKNGLPGGKPDSGSFIVPEVDSEVIVTFPFKTPYSAFYESSTISELTKIPGVFEEDYPNTYGFIDSIPSFLRQNKTQKEVEYYRGDKDFSFRIDAEGNFWLNVPKSFILNIKEDFQVKVGNDVAFKIGNNFGQDVGNVHEIKCNQQGINASSEISHQAGQIHHNSGISYDEVSGLVSALESKVSELESEIAAFKALAQTAQSTSNSNKSEIAKVD